MARSTFSIIKEALKGEHQDYTKGNISEAVILLAIPMILELSLESIFAVVDMFFVAKLGANAIATVGLTEAAITIIYSIGIGLSTGATAVVARRTGEKDRDGASRAGAQSIVLGLALSLVMSIVGVYYAQDILRLMGASTEVVNEGTGFARLMFGSAAPILLLFLVNGIFRGAGDAAMAMKSLWLASAINIVLCPIMIHFFGLPGAAVATIFGRSIGVVYQCYYLFKGSPHLQLRGHHFRLDWPVLKTISAISWPAGLQFIIGSGSWIILTRLVAETGGTAASAGYQIAFRNFIFFILPAWGLSNAAATLVGQSLGAKRPDRAEESVYVTAKYSMIAMGFVTLFFWIFAGPIIRIFSTDAEVVEHGIQALRILGSGYIFYGLAMVMSQALNGAGDSKTPTWINFFCFWVFQTPLAYFLALGLDMKSAGAVLAIPISETVLALVAWYFFKRGKWKTLAV